MESLQWHKNVRAVIDRPYSCGFRLLFPRRVEEIEDVLGNFAFTGFIPSGFEILLPVLCPWPAIVIDVAIAGRRELSRPAVDVDDIGQAFDERMAKVRAVET